MADSRRSKEFLPHCQGPQIGDWGRRQTDAGAGGDPDWELKHGRRRRWMLKISGSPPLDPVANSRQPSPAQVTSPLTLTHTRLLGGPMTCAPELTRNRVGAGGSPDWDGVCRSGRRRRPPRTNASHGHGRATRNAPMRRMGIRVEKGKRQREQLGAWCTTRTRSRLREEEAASSAV